MVEDKILDFSTVIPQIGREEPIGTARVRDKYFSTRRNYWIRKGAPEEIANWLALQGFSIYPHLARGKSTKALLLKNLRNYKGTIKVFIEEGISPREAKEYALNILAEKNRREDRSRYNLFTWGSP